MILRATLSMTILLQGLGPAQAHVPAGTVLGIWQWPVEALPVMDGDLSEWEVVPDSLWLDLNTLDADGNPLFWAPDLGEGGYLGAYLETGRYGTEADPADLTMRFAVGWNDDTDRLYFAQQRFDDVYDRDRRELPPTCGGDDAVEVHVDADHSGGFFYFRGDDFCESEPKACFYYYRQSGRYAQSALIRFPPVGDDRDAWHWMWASSATWHDKEPYSCCPDSYTLVGEHGTQATLTAEWWTRYYNYLAHDYPEESELAELSEGQIIGMGIAFCDVDPGTSDDADAGSAHWLTGGTGSPAWITDSDYLSDWILLPVSELWTGIERTSWGQVKASFTP
ncbi:MAG: hypothetical protein OXG13_20070 [Gemmatimonadaceae bacterium]|nr:hypothetical protein [Gemmatimonadaceae bacterium]